MEAAFGSSEEVWAGEVSPAAQAAAEELGWSTTDPTEMAMISGLQEDARVAAAPDPVTPPPAPSAPPAPPVPPKILSRSEILDSEDLATETVPVPEWGGAVIVRALTGSERDAYETSIFTARGVGKDPEYNLQNIRAKLAARTIVGEDGKRLFSDTDIVALGLKSAAALDRVFSVAQRLSRLTNEDVKELANQLGKDQSSGSGSA
jgi:hypothetical protein